MRAAARADGNSPAANRSNLGMITLQLGDQASGTRTADRRRNVAVRHVFVFPRPAALFIASLAEGLAFQAIVAAPHLLVVVRHLVADSPDNLAPNDPLRLQYDVDRVPVVVPRP